MKVCPREVHDEMCADLDTFLARTFHVGVGKRMTPQDPPLLYGNCPACADSLTIAIQEVPGHREKCRRDMEEERKTKTSDDATEASGEIETGFVPRPDPNGDDWRIT